MVPHTGKLPSEVLWQNPKTKEYDWITPNWKSPIVKLGPTLLGPEGHGFKFVVRKGRQGLVQQSGTPVDGKTVEFGRTSFTYSESGKI